MLDTAKTQTTSHFFKNNLTFIANHPVQDLLRELKRGIEKEGLRVDGLGNLAVTPHPQQLGSALTNPWLTTDFSESLLEFITPAFDSVEATLDYLDNIHSVAYKHLDTEYIWGSSMPCILPPDQQIPIAQYGTSNVAKMKTTYRRGLGHRYGRAMQTVAGIHYNFSLPQAFWDNAFENALKEGQTTHTSIQPYIDERYFDLIRNFRRNYWLLVYLFGAAPCVDKSFVQERPHQLEPLGDSDLYLPWATSLRMGDLGYQSAAQKSLFVCYNHLGTYIETLSKAMRTPYAPYEKIGVRDGDKYQQLSTALLQIENEFYSPIRPKRVTESGETPLHALSHRGVEYIEVRCLDINPFSPTGIDADTIRFLDTFLLYCLLDTSPQCDEEEFQLIADNQSRIVNEGRNPDLQIYCGKALVPIRECAARILNDIDKIAEQLDSAHGSESYQHSVTHQRSKVHDASLTPSAQVLAAMKTNNISHVEFTLEKSKAVSQHYRHKPIDADDEAALMETAEQSVAAQIELEQNQALSFEDFLNAYFGQ